MKRPSLDSLRILAECVRSGSFAAAADKFCLTPAAVSLRIRTLEHELGKALFLRRGPRVDPTASAISLAKRIDHALIEIDGALDKFLEALPVIRVTAPPTFSCRWLAARVEQYQAQNPEIAIELDVSTDVRSRDNFDIAVRTGSGRWPGWVSHPLFPVDLTPMLRSDLAAQLGIAQPSDLARVALLAHPDWPLWLRGAGAPGGFPFQFTAIEFPTHDLNAYAALASKGAALLPRSLFNAMLDEGCLIAPFDFDLDNRDWHIALLHEGETRPEVQDLLAWILEQLPEKNLGTRALPQSTAVPGSACGRMPLRDE